MTALPSLFADGVLDVHVANGVARITLGSAPAGGQDQKPVATGQLLVPVMQLPALARVLAEVTKQVEQRAKEAMAQAQAKAAAAAPQTTPAVETDQVTGAFRFNG
jgi:hypothetical protein